MGGIGFLALGGLSVFVTPYEGFPLGVTLLGFAVLFAVSSNVLKAGEAERIVNSIPWRGDKRVLDVGCGRGLWMIAAAKHLTTGSAVGVDIWDKGLQSGNSRQKAMENAELEGVAEKVEARDGDVRNLPFDDETFDLVISSLVVHHVLVAERKKAIGEIVRF